MKKYIKTAYDNCVFIFNNGFEYEFYKRLDRRPTKIILVLNDEQLLDFALENKRKYITSEEFDELWTWIKQDKKPWTFGAEPLTLYEKMVFLDNHKIRGELVQQEAKKVVSSAFLELCDKEKPHYELTDNEKKFIMEITSVCSIHEVYFGNFQYYPVRDRKVLIVDLQISKNNVRPRSNNPVDWHITLNIHIPDGTVEEKGDRTVIDKYILLDNQKLINADIGE